MAATSKRQLERILTDRLDLEKPVFDLEKLPGGKLSGSIVSDTFQGVDNIARQRMIWDALDEEFSSKSRDVVGTLLAYTKAEWHVPLQGDPSNVKRQRKSN